MAPSGRLDPVSYAGRVPRVTDLDQAPLQFPGVEVLQVMAEIGYDGALDILPPAVHPTIPPMATYVFYRCPESPVGPFTLAQIRLGCRAGVRQRALLARAYIDNQEAGALLREGWGYDCQPAEVRLHRGYDAIVGAVATDDGKLFEVGLVTPEPIATADLQFAANLNPAELVGEGVHRIRLLQAGPRFAFQRADRGRPALRAFEARLVGDERLRPRWPISAHFAVCDLLLPPVGYLTDPVRPAAEGTERISRPQAAAR